uniref:Putative secreted protein n=1 Tax=Ixodes ricinus TaxID=34613 RepID=A0A6B0UPQ9_IXORI
MSIVSGVPTCSMILVTLRVMWSSILATLFFEAKGPIWHVNQTHSASEQPSVSVLTCATGNLLSRMESALASLRDLGWPATVSAEADRFLTLATEPLQLPPTLLLVPSSALTPSSFRKGSFFP